MTISELKIGDKVYAEWGMDFYEGKIILKKDEKALARIKVFNSGHIVELGEMGRHWFKINK